MTHIEFNDETPDYSRGYADGRAGRAASCPPGFDEDLYVEGYEAGQQFVKESR